MEGWCTLKLRAEDRLNVLRILSVDPPRPEEHLLKRVPRPLHHGDEELWQPSSLVCAEGLDDEVQGEGPFEL